MRLFLRDSERRPDPTPVQTDDRKAVAVGLVLWLAALIVMLAFYTPIVAAGNSWWIVTCAVALVLGSIGLIYSIRRHGH
ncbi:DUF2530 domain-containing protein [Galbitalea soli]|uniref:DUF2530 domain-containing protein n=1 Tax=Galbitalea soli TaxID=1268042 RepID=A0A7C9PPJ7_9MICO|nr:DUF2530 domain-containing protein [Galbitalea soli]NEM92392.1 DUF2530 domain-containing protein [Galbitalea soli]NYJ31650.1 FtsH-binding integral membrane protein [Galbitalea soli]